MREAIVNAIVHNDFTREIPPVFEIFSDRIVMSSYGGLIPGQSEDDFFSCASMPRNRELMRVFKDVGLVEQLGSGMSRILHVYDRNIFDISDHFIKVVFTFDQVQKYSSLDTINDTVTNSILKMMNEQPKITAKELSEILHCSESKIKRITKKLKDDGKITRIGSDKTGHWKVN